MSAPPAAVKTRKRSSSIQQAMNEMERVPVDNSNSQPLAKPLTPSGFLNDLRTFKWMVNPLTSLKLIVLVLAAYFGLGWTLPEGARNPLAPFVFISYPLGHEAGEARTHYTKGPLDVCFLLFYIIVFSFVRQSITEFVVRPFAKKLGIRTESKQLRFMEQAYAAIYFTASGTFGLSVMAQQDSWWYKTEHFWLKYPHW